ncbi:MAG: PIG-L deacetylase family protein [Dehalococcoidia bacterium]
MKKSKLKGQVSSLKAKLASLSAGPGSPPEATAAPPAPPIGSAQQEAPPDIGTPKSAMVIMAHPDDAEFVLSGTVAKWCAEGAEVTYVLVTSGDKGTHDMAMTREKLAAMRESEQRAACKVLGVKECVFLGYPDGFTVDDLELRGQIVRLLRLYRPEVVLTWDGFRGSFNHRDHRNVGVSVMDAVYPVVRDRLFYERDEADGLHSVQVNEVLLGGAADPDYTVDITAHWETKIDAILCHTSQIGSRTREDFLKQRREQVEKDGEKPIEERFRRWSIRRPPRVEPKNVEAAEETAEELPAGAVPAPQAKSKGQRGAG